MVGKEQNRPDQIARRVCVALSPSKPHEENDQADQECNGWFDDRKLIENFTGCTWFVSLHSIDGYDGAGEQYIKDEDNKERAPGEVRRAANSEQPDQIQGCQSIGKIDDNSGDGELAAYDAVDLQGPVGDNYLAPELEHSQEHVKPFALGLVYINFHLLLNSNSNFIIMSSSHIYIRGWHPVKLQIYLCEFGIEGSRQEDRCRCMEVQNIGEMRNYYYLIASANNI